MGQAEPWHRCPASPYPQGAPARGSRRLPRERGQHHGAFGGLRLELSRCQPGAQLPACPEGGSRRAMKVSGWPWLETAVTQG